MIPAAEQDEIVRVQAAGRTVAQLARDFHRSHRDVARVLNERGVSRRHYTRGSQLDRWEARVVPRVDGCWDWAGAHVPSGAGHMNLGEGRYGLAHRVGYELLIGPIPEGLEAWPVCRRIGCVNPTHRELITRHEVVIRADSKNMRAHRAGTCTRGHPVAVSYRRGDGRVVQCTVCRREGRGWTADRACLHCAGPIPVEKNARTRFCSATCREMERRAQIQAARAPRIRRHTPSPPLCPHNILPEGRIAGDVALEHLPKEWAPTVDAGLSRRFWGRVNKTDCCWLWTGGVSKQGYGMISVRRPDGQYRGYLAHRLSLIMAAGPIPVGYGALHHCDTPSCVRPDHLYPGTQAHNMADLKERGNFHPVIVPRGESNRLAKLTEPLVRQIRARRMRGETLQAIANDVGIGASGVSAIARGLAWRHVDAPIVPTSTRGRRTR